MMLTNLSIYTICFIILWMYFCIACWHYICFSLFSVPRIIRKIPLILPPMENLPEKLAMCVHSSITPFMKLMDSLCKDRSQHLPEYSFFSWRVAFAWGLLGKEKKGLVWNRNSDKMSIQEYIDLDNLNKFMFQLHMQGVQLSWVCVAADVLGELDWWGPGLLLSIRPLVCG